MAEPRVSDPDKVAYYEAEGWRAYYDHNWLRAFRLMVQLNRQEFAMSWPAAVAGAVDIVRASIAFAPLVVNDPPKAEKHLRYYYARVLRFQPVPADAARLAQLEIAYWIVHRELAIARKKDPRHEGDLEPMVQALVDLHAALFGATPEAMRQSAELRAMAAQAVDRITGGYSLDVEEDWRQVEDYLRQAYRSIASQTIRTYGRAAPARS
jgi:hypothetical protein